MRIYNRNGALTIGTAQSTSNRAIRFDLNDGIWAHLNFLPHSDSVYDLGRSSGFWDETYTDELVLMNVGTAATAANTVRLAGLDLGAGDAGLLITSEDDTNYIFGSKVGFGTTTPSSFFTVGTTTELFIIDGAGNVGIASSTPYVKLGIEENVVIDGDLTVNGDFFIKSPDIMDVHATTTQIFTNGSFGAIEFDVVDLALGDMSFTAYEASTTIPHTDNYDISFQGIVDKTGGGNETAQVMLFINNIEHPECYSEVTLTANSITFPISFRCIESLNANDVLVVKARADGADTQFAAIGAGVTGDIAVATWIIGRIE